MLAGWGSSDNLRRRKPCALRLEGNVACASRQD
jgi:hypothetical protein